jgi:hypothetical protein
VSKRNTDTDSDGPRLAKECVQFIATTLDGTHQVPFAYYLVEKANAALISDMITDSIWHLRQILVDVRCIVMDGASEHRAWQQSVLTICDPAAGGRSDFPVAMPNPCYPYEPEKKIFVMSDPVHIMKKAASNLFSSGSAKFHTKGFKRNGQAMTWEQVYTAWLADQQRGKGPMLLARKVTREHMDRTSFTRLKVRFSTQVLSSSMALCLETYGGGCESHVDGKNDVMNSGKYRREWRGKRGYLSQPITSEDDRRLEFLLDFARDIERWEVEAGTKREFMTRETAFDLRLACRAFVAFAQHNLDEAVSFEPVNLKPDEPGLYGNTEMGVVMKVLGGIIPRLFNQDPVEAHFSRLRASGGARDHLNPMDLAAAQASVQTERLGVNGNTTARDDTYTPMEIPVITKRRRKKETAAASERGRQLAASAHLNPIK